MKISLLTSEHRLRVCCLLLLLLYFTQTLLLLLFLLLFALQHIHYNMSEDFDFLGGGAPTSPQGNMDHDPFEEEHEEVTVVEGDAGGFEQEGDQVVVHEEVVEEPQRSSSLRSSPVPSSFQSQPQEDEELSPLRYLLLHSSSF
jgi:hypothetical protein